MTSSSLSLLEQRIINWAASRKNQRKGEGERERQMDRGRERKNLGYIWFTHASTIMPQYKTRMCTQTVDSNITSVTDHEGGFCYSIAGEKFCDHTHFWSFFDETSCFQSRFMLYKVSYRSSYLCSGSSQGGSLHLAYHQIRFRSRFKLRHANVSYRSSYHCSRLQPGRKS